MLTLLITLQVDNRGRNFLHVAILNSDIESVLFLISVHAYVNSRVQDSQNLTPLHLAVQVGSEIIVRNLVSNYQKIRPMAQGGYSNIFIRRLGSFFGVQNFEFRYFGGGFRKMNIFGGMKILWIFFDCHQKIGQYLGVISMHFSVFS